MLKNLIQIISDFPLSDKSNQKLLAIGTHVRILLDYPKDVYNQKRFGGKFRSSDIRWTEKNYKTKEVLLRPGFCPLYIVDDGTTIQHTVQQFHFVPHFLKYF
jgi:hypothetical protein